jgi:hypothetical protein
VFAGDTGVSTMGGDVSTKVTGVSRIDVALNVGLMVGLSNTVGDVALQEQSVNVAKTMMNIQGRESRAFIVALLEPLNINNYYCTCTPNYNKIVMTDFVVIHYP